MIRLKIAARNLGVAAVDLANGEFVLTAADQTKVDPERLLRLMTQSTTAGGLRVTPGHKIFAPAPGGAAPAAELFDSARRLLAHLGG